MVRLKLLQLSGPFFGDPRFNQFCSHRLSCGGTVLKLDEAPLIDLAQSNQDLNRDVTYHTLWLCNLTQLQASAYLHTLMLHAS